MRLGMPVLDIASALVGYVTAVTPAAFQTALSDNTMVWLSDEALLSICDSTVALVCSIERIARYTVAEPTAA